MPSKINDFIAFPTRFATIFDISDTAIKRSTNPIAKYKHFLLNTVFFQQPDTLFFRLFGGKNGFKIFKFFIINLRSTENTCVHTKICTTWLLRKKASFTKMCVYLCTIQRAMKGGIIE
jgi:hypothetical protein